VAFASTGASKAQSASEVDYLAFGAFEAGLSGASVVSVKAEASVVEDYICSPHRFVSLRGSRSSNGYT